MNNTEKMRLIIELCENGMDADEMPCFLRKWSPVRLLGKGTYGKVFLVRRGGERCAVKVMRFSQKMIERYTAEIKALTRIRKEKHAVDIYEYETVLLKGGAFEGKYLVIRMEYLNKLPEKMTEDDVIELAIQLCSVLEICHSGEPIIYHRDIKPDNILVSDDGTYKLTDFGEAKLADHTRNMSGFHGTPLYMSPEMHDFLGYDGRSDLYSLGVTMYALLDGSAPFMREENGNMTAAIRRRFSGEILPDIQGVSRRMMQIIRRLCAVAPENRYRTASDLQQALVNLSADNFSRSDSANRSGSANHRRSTHNDRSARYPDGYGAGDLLEDDIDFLDDDEFEDDYGYADYSDGYASNPGGHSDRSGGYASAPGGENKRSGSGGEKRNSGAGKKGSAGKNSGNTRYDGNGGGAYEEDAGEAARGAYISLDEPYYSDGYDPFSGSDVFRSDLYLEEYNPDPWYLPEHLRDKPKKKILSRSDRKSRADGVNEHSSDKLAGAESMFRTKKKTVALIISLAAALLLWLAIYSSVPALYLSFEPVNGGWEVTACSPMVRRASVPRSYKGQPVVSIGKGAFDECDRLRRLTIAENVNRISFSDVGTPAGLEEFRVSKKNMTYKSVDGVLLSRSGHILVRCPRGMEGYYTVPDGVERIADRAFYCCGGIDGIYIPSGVTSIGRGSFGGCTGLDAVRLPGSVTFIGQGAFYGCDVTVWAEFPPEKCGYALDSGVYWVSGAA